MWFERDLVGPLRAPALPARVLVGPRQTGKSSLLARLVPGATWLSLDDVQVRLQAEQDPALLLDVGGSMQGHGSLAYKGCDPSSCPEL